MIVAYTAIFGGSDSLKAAPAGADRAVCFTDGAHTDSRGWEIVQREVGDRGRRAARVLKMSPHELFADATASVWVDGSIAIQDWQALIADSGDADVACFAHPDRTNCYDEGRTVVRLKIAHQAKVMAALEMYRRDGFNPTSLSTTGLLYRKHGPGVVAFNTLWRSHLATYGTNDQVHVDYCAWRAGVSVHHLQGHYRENPYAVYDKVDHHRRRKPQFFLERDCVNYLA
jgi:Protein of unknown function (DUF616)